MKRRFRHHAASQGRDDTYIFCVKNLRWLRIGFKQKPSFQENGVTTLATAAAKGLEATVRFLIDAGADVNKASNRGITPLTAASYLNHDAVARMLRDAGARLEASTVM